MTAKTAPRETGSLVERKKPAFAFEGASGETWWRVVLTCKASDAFVVIEDTTKEGAERIADTLVKAASSLAAAQEQIKELRSGVGEHSRIASANSVRAERAEAHVRELRSLIERVWDDLVKAAAERDALPSVRSPLMKKHRDAAVIENTALREALGRLVAEWENMVSAAGAKGRRAINGRNAGLLIAARDVHALLGCGTADEPAQSASQDRSGQVGSYPHVKALYRRGEE